MRITAERNFSHIATFKLRMRVGTSSIVETGGLRTIKSTIINMIFEHKQYYTGKGKSIYFTLEWESFPATSS